MLFEMYVSCVIEVVHLMCHLGCMSDVSSGLYVSCVIWIVCLMYHLSWMSDVSFGLYV